MTSNAAVHWLTYEPLHSRRRRGAGEKEQRQRWTAACLGPRAAGELCFPRGWLWLSSDYSSRGLTLIKMLRQERVLVAQGTPDFMYFQSTKSRFPPGGQKKKISLSLSSMLHLYSFNLLPLLPLWNSSGGLTLKWHCTVRDRLWLLEVGVGL